MYAKINTLGEVIQFPYNIDVLPHEDIPSDAVVVDLETNKPQTTWKQIYNITSVEKVGESYIATFTINDRYANQTEMLEGIKSLKKMHQDINQRSFKQKVNELTKESTSEEIISWDAQAAEALAYQSDNSTSIPLLTNIALSRGISVDELVQKVLDAVNAYNISYGALLGKFQKNNTLLSSINLEDNTTWDIIDSIERF